MNMLKSVATAAALSLAAAGTARASAVYHNLSGGSFSQDWTNTSLITTDDDWSGVPSIVGFRGDNGTQATAVDPRTILVDTVSTVVDVNANKTDPLTFFTGGATEFELTNPTVALFGSGTADSPNLIIHIDSTGVSNVVISYTLQDIEAGTDDAVSQFALQYRIGTTGNFTNADLASGTVGTNTYVADATTGGTAVQTTQVTATNPAWSNVAQLQFRIMTTNAAGNDEAVGVDNIVVAVPEPTSLAAIGLGAIGLLRRRRSR